MQIVEYKFLSRCFGMSSGVGVKLLLKTIDKYFVNKGFKKYFLYLVVFLISPFLRAICKYRRTEISKCLSYIESNRFVYWFHPNHKKNRVYVICFDSTPYSFIKFTFDYQNTQLIKNEANALMQFSGARSFSVPRLVDFKEFNEGRIGILETELLSDGCKRFVKQKDYIPSEIINEIISFSQGSLPSGSFVCTEVLKLSGKEFFDEEYVNKLLSIYRAEPAHGDLGSQNILVKGTSIFVIDWERYSTCAPLYSDFIGYMLGLFNSEIRARRLSCNAFHQHCLSHVKISLERLSLCLLFYCALDFDLAKTLLESHHEVKRD